MTPNDFAARLERLEDIDALKQLKYSYCAACDDNYDAERIASLFTPDGVWDGGDLGRFEGRDAIRATFHSVKNSVKFGIHHVTNPMIDVTRDRATCNWYLALAKIDTEGKHSTLFAGMYRNICLRQAGQWYFTQMNLIMHALPLVGRLADG